MDIGILIEVIAALITTILAMIVGFRVLALNSASWLNRWFTLFFISSSLGFLIYTIYHLITNNSDIIIPLMVTTHIFFNFAFVSLMMTVFILEKFAKIAMSLQCVGTMMVLFLVMSLGYFIWVPKLKCVARCTCNYKTISSNSLSNLTPKPVPPGPQYALPVLRYAGPAMSICAQRVSAANSERKSAAVMAPPARLLLMLFMSAKSLFSSSL